MTRLVRQQQLRPTGERESRTLSKELGFWFQQKMVLLAELTVGQHQWIRHGIDWSYVNLANYSAAEMVRLYYRWHIRSH